MDLPDLDKENQKLIVKLDKMRQSDYLMAIKYHGSPRQGVQFFPEIQQYTQAHYGKSVSTKDFQTAMEKACQKDLQAFFAQWCYGK